MYKFLALFALSALIVAQQPGYEHALEELFNLADADGNEHLTAAEAGAFVTSLDPDNDGTVDITEFTAALAANTVFAGFESQLYSALDVNGDGLLNAAELANFITFYDTNNDGEISKGEWLQPHTSHGPPTAKSP